MYQMELTNLFKVAQIYAHHKNVLMFCRWTSLTVGTSDIYTVRFHSVCNSAGM